MHLCSTGRKSLLETIVRLFRENEGLQVFALYHSYYLFLVLFVKRQDRVLKSNYLSVGKKQMNLTPSRHLV
jgi:hypothetical protein